MKGLTSIKRTACFLQIMQKDKGINQYFNIHLPAVQAIGLAFYRFFFLVVFTWCIEPVYAQTSVPGGEISGKWTKTSSPYIITGDINIPGNEKLVIEPGVEVRIKSGCKINVQGSLVAKGTITDSIIFTLGDTTALAYKGWNGIRFDARPVTWDTSVFKMPKREVFRKHARERIQKGELDTTPMITLRLACPDLVNDTILDDNIFKCDTGSVLSYCRLEYAAPVNKPKPYFFGGAVYIYRYSNLVISHCVFENNRALAGGAIYCKEAAPVITGNRIVNNYAESSAGAISFIYSGAIVLDNEFSNNRSGYNGGALLFHESCPYVCNNTLVNNVADNQGGGFYFEKETHHLLFDGTTLPEEKTGFTKKLIVNEKELPKGTIKKATNMNGRFINNVICNNIAKDGGGIGIIESSPEFVNNTIACNTTDRKGSGVACYHASPNFINTIIYDNKAGEGNGQIFLYGKSSPLVSFCNIPSGVAGIANDTVFSGSVILDYNISDDPLFKDPAKNDFYLKENSPCIDAGLNNLAEQLVYSCDNRGKNRKYNSIIDIGAIEFLGQKTIKKDAETDDNENYGNDDITEISISIYPNPVSDRFTIDIHNNVYEKIYVDIYNQNGQKVFVNEYKGSQWFSEKINMGNMQSGAYIIVIYAGDEILFNNMIIKE